MAGLYRHFRSSVEQELSCSVEAEQSDENKHPRWRMMVINTDNANREGTRNEVGALLCHDRGLDISFITRGRESIIKQCAA